MRKKIRFIHWSDSHLGFFRFNKSNSQGINQRMMDFQDSFVKSVDHIIERKPDFTIHSGDIFETPYPPNRSRKLVNEQLKRLDDSNIPTIVLSGTHELPRTKKDIHVFKLITGLKNIYMVTEPEKVELNINGQLICIYCVPYSTNFSEMEHWFLDTVAEEKDPNAYNFLVLHADVAGVAQLEHGINIIRLPNDIGEKFDYVALGHFHTYHPWCGKDNVIYAGSTDKKNFDEGDEDKYIHEVILNDGKVKVENIKLDVRPVHRFTVDLTEYKDVGLAEDAIRKLKSKIKDGSVVQVILRASFELYKSLNLKSAYDWFPQVLYVETPWEELVIAQQKDIMALNVAGNLVNEWKVFLNVKDEDRVMKKWLAEKGEEKLKLIIGE